MAEVAPLRQKLAGVPDAPGVYLYRDAAGRVLYVGKAKSLRRRVLSYFRAPLRSEPAGRAAPMTARSGQHPKVGDLVSRISDVEVFVTGTETEATILEANLVRRHKPAFNVRLRDDKSYPYIGISLDEEYPRVYFTRERHRRDRRYFGPFSSAYRVRDTLRAVGKIFPSRPCEGPEPGRASGVPCLDYHIRRCMAPCVDYISREEYRALIDRIIDLLSGRYEGLERELQREMRQASDRQDFETAAICRNRLAAVRGLTERQRATTEGGGTVDVLGLAVDEEAACVQVVQVRDGVLQDRHTFFLDGAVDETAALEGFAHEYYAMGAAIPPLVLIPRGMAVDPGLAGALAQRRGARVELRAPERGDKRVLSDMAQRNARLALEGDRLRLDGQRQVRRAGLAELAEALGLSGPPARIECFDVSNLGETHSVASMVVLEGGAPARAHYRSFALRHEGGPDDFARMREAVRRRFTRLADGDDDPSFSARPGLVVIDGGAGQLTAALAGLDESEAGRVPMVALAKKREELFLEGRTRPLLIDRARPGLRLLIQLRDEAHRFALRHHRGRRGRAMTASILDAIPGVGPARKRALMQHFGTPERVLAAEPDELAAVPGVPAKLAGVIHNHLHRTAAPDGALAGTEPAWS